MLLASFPGHRGANAAAEAGRVAMRARDLWGRMEDEPMSEAIGASGKGRAGAKAKPATDDYRKAWIVRAPEDDVWSARPWVHSAQRAEAGKAAHIRAPRSSHATFEPAADRDPIAILERQEADRLLHLLPIRHARMADSAFAYYRGTPAVMAFDLASTPRTDIIVQAGGDAHCGNFGLFASPERTLVFDTNDFDETFPAPWEWDVKRLAPSISVV